MRRFAALYAFMAAACFPVFAATIQVPGDIAQEATGPAGANVSYTVTANGSGTGDDENGRPTSGTANISCSHASGAAFALGTTTVTCSATDSASTATGTFKVTVTDTTAPSLSLPANIHAQASSSTGAVISFAAQAHDLVDGARGVDCSPGPGNFPVGTTTVTCTSSDTRGNTATGSFSVTIGAPPPQNPPTLQLPSDITVEATGAAGAAVSYVAKSNGGGNGQDDENGRPTDGSSPVCAPASGSTFALGTTTVQCSATNSGGTSTGSFTVTVVDTTEPTLNIPRDFTVQGSSNDGATVTWDASANDLVDGSVAVTCTPASGSNFAVGTTAVSCTATDAHGNSATGGFSVTVTPPDAPPPPPTLNLPDDITVEADGPNGTIVTFTATSNGGGNGGGDDFNGRPTDGSSVTCAPASGALFALGATTVQCSAGSASGTFLVHVVDTTAPALTLPADITTDETTVTFDATASDVVDGSVAVTCTPASGSTFDVGTTAVNCSATDAAGNSAAGSFNVTVNDTGTPGRVITVTASPNKIWPPNKNMVPVTLAVTISDDSQFTANIISVGSSESDPDDRTTPDWVITGPLTVDLRAEKSEQAQKRTYTIVVDVVDDTNTSHHKTVSVSVQSTGTTSTSEQSKAPSEPTKKRKGRG